MADLFFYASKIFWLIAQPDHFLLLMLVLGLLLWRSVIGVTLVWSSVFVLLIVSFFSVANYLLEPLEQRFPQPVLSELEGPISGIVILGGAENASLTAKYGSPQFSDAAERMMVIPKLDRAFPNTAIIFSGGSSAILNNQFLGGDVAKMWLSDLDLSSPVIIDKSARNTFENAIYTREIILDRTDDNMGRWILVTSAFHMPRAVGVFREVGLNVVPYPVDFRVSGTNLRINLNANMADLNTAVREWIGLVAYYLSEKTSELLPAPNENKDIEPQ